MAAVNQFWMVCKRRRIQAMPLGPLDAYRGDSIAEASPCVEEEALGTRLSSELRLRGLGHHARNLDVMHASFIRLKRSCRGGSLCFGQRYAEESLSTSLSMLPVG
jgi:hypothetical protein